MTTPTTRIMTTSRGNVIDIFIIILWRVQFRIFLLSPKYYYALSAPSTVHRRAYTVYRMSGKFEGLNIFYILNMF